MGRRLYTWLILQTLLLTQVHGQVVWEGRTQNVDSLVSKAIGYLHMGNVDQAISLSRTVLAKYPSYVDFSYILGLSYQKIGQPDWSIPYMERVIAQDANYRDAYIALANLYESTKADEKARHIWKTTQEKFPQDQELYQRYQEFIQREMLNTRDRRMDQLYKEGKKTLSSGAWEKALAYSDSMETIQKDDIRLLYLRSSAFTQGKKYEEAKASYESIRARGDTSLFITEQLTNIAAAQKDYTQALRYALQLQQASPQTYRFTKMVKKFRENLPYDFYVGLNHTQIAQDRPHGHFFISGVEFGHQIGTNDMLIGQFNYGNRRGEKGYQMALDAWLNYDSKMYAYHHIAWADGSVFPTWRAAYSLYREAGRWLFDVGGRYVRSSDRQDNYGAVVSAGYTMNTVFVYLRSFLLHDEYRWNQAYSLSLRHYYNEEKPRSYVTIIGDIGTSPDDQVRYQFLNNRFNFLSRSIHAGWQHQLGRWSLGFMGGWSYYKVAESRFLNQYDLNLSLKKYF
ncbi:YaiO family outer membrane beta-barrel protein [Sphingobacterium sp. SGG-5]|uniref:YaiO family outer membrane beta-barrel protein n=1 Tax=Sphingobacterium sp. SGG-5 TaxID=2710881 RepID=UPI0013ED8207|nr:YaiO family outer membrane beta-barrel protein [Sphingobacterium sp. SGG-5]NGM61373.1 YaiO family outer membrane beta-barrel protein [Sphingobacterium sp. SGG-5]